MLLMMLFRVVKCLQGQGQLMPMRLSLLVCLLVGAYMADAHAGVWLLSGTGG